MSAPSEDQILEKAKELCRCEGNLELGRNLCLNAEADQVSNFCVQFDLGLIRSDRNYQAIPTARIAAVKMRAIAPPTTDGIDGK
jgi:hypothetical protein